jgi:membrane protein required for colicin V production
MENFSVCDVVFVIAMLLALVIGYMKGLVRQLLGLVGIFVGTYCSYKLSGGLTKWWHGYFDINVEIAKIIVFIILSSIIYILVLWLAKLVGKLLKMAMLNWINRLFGMMFSAIKVLIIFCVLAYAIHYLKSTGIDLEFEDLNKSKAYNQLISIANSVFFFFKPYTT